MNLNGRVALVTGATGAVGRQLVPALARHGALVAVHYHRDSRRAQKLVRSVRGLSTASAFAADLRGADAPRRLVQAVLRRFGRLDVLIHGAAVFGRTPLRGASPRSHELLSWEDTFALNLRSAFLCARAAAPALRKAPADRPIAGHPRDTARGVMVHLADVGGRVPWAGYAAYGASKAALLMLTRSLAKAWAPRIRVGAVSPGVLDLPSRLSPALRRSLRAKTALKRLPTVDDVVEAVLFFIEDATFMTGSDIVVDAGRSMWG